jgi:PTH1 family peptidyl-tRNA hydrolase
MVGLGNPGKKYARTRHNVGAMVLDRLEKDDEMGRAGLMDVSRDRRVIFFQPQTFMNQSGAPVMLKMKQERIEPQNLIVVHDDVDIPVGEIKIQKNRTSAGHKGVQSIIDQLGTQDFWRVRVGIGRPAENQETDQFVLEPLPAADWKKIEQSLTKIKREIGRIL